MTKVRIKEPTNAEELRAALLQMAVDGDFGALKVRQDMWPEIIDEVVKVAETPWRCTDVSPSVQMIGDVLLTSLEKRISLDEALEQQLKHVANLEALGYWKQ